MRFLTPLLLRLGLYHPLRKLAYAVRNRGRSAGEVFSDIYRNNRWQGSESRSGEGSSPLAHGRGPAAADAAPRAEAVSMSRLVHRPVIVRLLGIGRTRRRFENPTSVQPAW